MTHHSQRLLLALFVLVFCPVYAPAQVQTGTPPFGSFGGGPDAINLANLNSHITIPVLHKQGRALAFKDDLVYDNSVWFPVGSSGSQSWQPAFNWGWIGTGAVLTGYVTRSETVIRTCRNRTGQIIGYDFLATNYAYHDQLGQSHPVPGQNIIDSGTCGSGSSLNSGTSDGSGYLVSADQYGDYTVYASNGSNVSTNLGNSVTDRNGNYISLSGGVFTDTLGTTELTVTGAAPNSVYFKYSAPSGATVQVTVNYTQYTVATNFGISGISEFHATSEPLVSSIVLPDGTQYTLGYEATPTVPSSGACTPLSGTYQQNCVTARLASLILPTGGTISYSYTGGNNGILSDGTSATLTRTTPDGTWTYAHSESGSAWTTTVTDPQSNNTVIQFQGIYETERQVYQGAVAPANLLKTINTCYNGNTSNCTTTAVALPITQRNITDILPGANNLQCQHIYKYNSNGSLTEQDDYDYGSGAPGALLKKTAITFASLGNITAFRQQVTVTNGAGTTISQANYNYDETAVVTTSGTPNHSSVSGSRGNLTSINFYTQGSTFLTKRMTYFDTGKVQTVTDVNGAQTTYTYGACGNSFPTSVSEPLTLSRSMTWNCTGGVQLTVTDENSQTNTTAFTDPYFWRPASVTDPTTAATNITYTNQTQMEASLSFNSGNSALDVLATRDTLGRPHLSQLREAPNSTNFDSTEFDYDSLGRPSRTTLPFVATAGQTNSSAPSQTKTYDALGRITNLSDNSSGYRSFSYSQNDVYITRGPAPTGENTKRRQEEYDALGRLTSVCEITSASDGGTCGQQVSQTGYWTQYTYNALGRLTAVTQNAQSSGSTQTRSFVYDLMGRLTSETHPESGTTTYAYDSDSTCGTSSGDRVKRTDAMSNVTCYTYDALHRLLTITYPSGTYASVTPAKHFVYDAATVNGQAMAYVKGRPAEAYTCTGSCTTKLTDVGISFTVRGEPSDTYQSSPNSGGYYHVSAQYWANSALKQLGSLTGLPTITYTPDGEGRPYEVSASSGQNPVTNTVFNAASLPTSITYGSSDSDSFTFDPNTNWLTQYKFTVNSQSEIGALTWNPNHTLQSLNITDPFNSTDTQNCSFSHDDLTRLASANCGSVWSQTFAYDAFGNISKSGTYSFLPIYKNTNGLTTNRYVSIPGTTVSYDADGNVLSDGSHTYSMDSAGKAITADSVNLTYDALGRIVEQNRSGTYTQIVYSPTGAKLALFNGQTLQKAFVPLPAGSVAVYNSSGLLYYGHPDHLGSVRLGSSPSRTISFDIAYAPFGETYAPSGTTDPSFTGQRQDTAPGLYDFPHRQYGTQGRWPVPDPAGLSSMHLSDPQSLNRYAYVRNNPLVMIDPQGLDECDDEGSGDSFSGEGGCGSSSGGGGGGGVSSGDPTYGGDPNNNGGDCNSNDAACSGNSGNQPPGSCPPGDGCDTSSGQSGDAGQTSVWFSATECSDTSCVNQTVVAVTADGPSADDQRIQQLANLVVQDAGAIGSPWFPLEFWASSGAIAVLSESLPGGAIAGAVGDALGGTAAASALAYQTVQFYQSFGNAAMYGPQRLPSDFTSPGGWLGWVAGSLSWWYTE
jgi:RHS repeat-associated protein